MSLGQKAAVLENILAKLIKSAILPHDCYLAGGTALYFHLHHRLSVDLDFFSPKPFSPETFIFKFRAGVWRSRFGAHGTRNSDSIPLPRKAEIFFILSAV